MLDALTPWIERHRRKAWRPVLGSAGEIDRPRSLSQFGGAPALRHGESVPACGSCGRPLDLLVQLDGRETPADSPWSGPIALQLFYCLACDDWQPFSKSHKVRAMASQELLAPVPGSPAALPQRAVVRWEAVRDSPHPEEQDALGLHLDYDFKAGSVTVRCPDLKLVLPGVDLGAADADGNELAEAISKAVPGDKLGGWPAWVQGVEYPSCPRCAAKMRYVIQIDSNGGVDHMFGDAGRGHVSQCPTHADVLAFTWACS